MINPSKMQEALEKVERASCARMDLCFLPARTLAPLPVCSQGYDSSFFNLPQTGNSLENEDGLQLHFRIMLPPDTSSIKAICFWFAHLTRMRKHNIHTAHKRESMHLLAYIHARAYARSHAMHAYVMCPASGVMAMEGMLTDP
jgi:hypothetical protein